MLETWPEKLADEVATSRSGGSRAVFSAVKPSSSLSLIFVVGTKTGPGLQTFLSVQGHKGWL